MAERGTALDHSTVQKWVVYYAPQLEEAFRKRKKPVGRSWKMERLTSRLVASGVIFIERWTRKVKPLILCFQKLEIALLY